MWWHAGIGKVSFDTDKLVENVRAFVDAVSKAKPAGAKGTYMEKVSLSSTMGPGVSVDVSSATGQLSHARIPRTARPVPSGRAVSVCGSGPFH